MASIFAALKIDGTAVYLLASTDSQTAVPVTINALVPPRLMSNPLLAREIPAMAFNATIGRWSLNVLADDPHIRELWDKPLEIIITPIDVRIAQFTVRGTLSAVQRGDGGLTPELHPDA